MMNEQQKERLIRLAKIADGGDISLFLEILDIEDRIKALLELKKGNKGDKGESIVGPVGPRGPKGEDGKSIVGPKGDRGDDASVDYDYILSQIPKPKDGKDGDIKDLSPEEIRDSLELLQGEERLPIKAINNLREELDELKKMIAKKVVVSSGGGSTGGHSVKTYDISSQLNGVLKTFALPAFWRIIDVKIGTIPPLRPDVDYTSDASAMTVTFTDEIPAETYLSTGLSAIIIYAE